MTLATRLEAKALDRRLVPRLDGGGGVGMAAVGAFDPLEVGDAVGVAAGEADRILVLGVQEIVVGEVVDRAMVGWKVIVPPATVPPVTGRSP